jgi:hypothetical protein
MDAAPVRPRALGRVEEELRARTWRGTGLGCALVTLTELAYVFIDYAVFHAQLLARRERLGARWLEACFVGAVLPFLPLFALAEHAMVGTGLVWVPMTGHRLVMLALGVLAPTGLWLGSGLIVSFALEAVVLWYALGLGHHPGVRSPWEPWGTLIYGAVGLGLMAYRVRTFHIELELREARAQAEALERLARFFLAMRDATNTPLQTLELGLALLRKRHPGVAPSLAPMERSVERLRALAQRMGIADPLVVWREGDESFDAESMLQHLEEELARELERRRQ